MNREKKPLEVSENVFWVGALDPDLKSFDLVMPLEKGTTYNSYLILDEKITLVDVVKTGFGDQLMKNVSEIVEPADIDYIVINHFEQDHTGFLLPLLDVAKKAQLIISKNAPSFLKETFNRDIPHITVTDDTEVSLGKRKLRFYRAPFLHWPDTMFEYLLPDRILFTCDAFGFHYCEIDEERAEKLDWNLWYYYDLIMRPFREYVSEAVAKVEDLDINAICPSHGPIRKKDPGRIIDSYRKWSRRESQFDDNTVMLVYSSFYSNTARIAEEIARGITQEGIQVHLLFHVWDLFKVLSVISRKGKPAATFGSYGWNALGIKIADDVLRHLGFKIDLDSLKIRLTPTEHEMGEAFDFGRAFAGSAKKLLELKKPAR
jgi:flavorubredoxin